MPPPPEMKPPPTADSDKSRAPTPTPASHARFVGRRFEARCSLFDVGYCCPEYSPWLAKKPNSSSLRGEAG
jgi:hypothetical protein